MYDNIHNKDTPPDVWEYVEISYDTPSGTPYEPWNYSADTPSGTPYEPW